MKKKTIFIILVTLAVLGIGLYVFFQTSSKPPSTETEEIQIPTQVENSDWKTYTNTKYGYEIQYPPEWEAWYRIYGDDTIYPVQGDEESLDIGIPYWKGKRLIRGEVSVTMVRKIGRFVSVGTYEDLVQVLQENSESSFCAMEGREIIIDKKRGFTYECSGGGSQFTSVYVFNKEFIYAIFADYEDKAIPSKTFPKILKTFKFIEPQ